MTLEQYREELADLVDTLTDCTLGQHRVIMKAADAYAIAVLDEAGGYVCHDGELDKFGDFYERLKALGHAVEEESDS